MTFFTIVGIVTCVLLAAGAALVVVAAVRGRMVGEPIRTFTVVDAYSEETLGHRWLFWTARRLARSRRGTRIVNNWTYGYASYRSGWSERENGYIGPQFYAHDVAKLMGLAEASHARDLLNWHDVPVEYPLGANSSEFVYPGSAVVAALGVRP